MISEKFKLKLRPATGSGISNVGALWFLFIIAFPFYLTRSGMPQLSSLVMVLLLFLTFAEKYRLSPEFYPGVKYFAAFAAYTVITTAVWLPFLNQKDARVPSYMYPVFYIYDVLVLIALLSFLSREGLKGAKILVYGVMGSVFLQTILSPFNFGDSRNSLFFNNPNQLGYFAILSCAFVAFGTLFIRLNTVYQSAFYVCSIYIASISLSKAATIGTAALLVIVGLHQGLFSIRKFAALLLAALALVVGILFSEPGEQIKSRVVLRISKIGDQADDNFAGRGYMRIVEFPEYLVFGAGEGSYERFGEVIEIHSTFASLIFCYGIIGFGLFLKGLFELIKSKLALAGLYLFPIFLYGITHNGIRFTILWVLLGFVYYLCGQTIVSQPAGRTAAQNWRKQSEQKRPPAFTKKRNRWD